MKKESYQEQLKFLLNQGELQSKSLQDELDGLKYASEKSIVDSPEGIIEGIQVALKQYHSVSSEEQQQLDLMLSALHKVLRPSSVNEN